MKTVMLTAALSLLTCSAQAQEHVDGVTGATPQNVKTEKKYENPSRLHIGGYGEAVMTRNFYSQSFNRYKKPENYANDKSHGRFDLPHVCLNIGYDFGNGWTIGSEIEFEHGGNGTAVEIEAEEAGEYEEVGDSKIGLPYTGEDATYIESPYAYNSIIDFYDNIQSCKNALYGQMDATAPNEKSLIYFCKNAGNATLATQANNVVAKLDAALAKIKAMKAPFALYYSDASTGCHPASLTSHVSSLASQRQRRASCHRQGHRPPDGHHPCALQQPHLSAEYRGHRLCYQDDRQRLMARIFCRRDILQLDDILFAVGKRAAAEQQTERCRRAEWRGGNVLQRTVHQDFSILPTSKRPNG